MHFTLSKQVINEKKKWKLFINRYTATKSATGSIVHSWRMDSHHFAPFAEVRNIISISRELYFPINVRRKLMFYNEKKQQWWMHISWPDWSKLSTSFQFVYSSIKWPDSRRICRIATAFHRTWLNFHFWSFEYCVWIIHHSWRLVICRMQS